MLHLGHVRGTYINPDRKITCLVAKESNFNAAAVHASVRWSIFPSLTTPTWQGNSRSSDLKEGETGRGEGRTREKEAEAGRNRFRRTETAESSLLKAVHAGSRGSPTKGEKDGVTVPLTLPHGLFDEVMLGLQLGDQVPAFEKLLQLLQKKQDIFKV